MASGHNFLYIFLCTGIVDARFDAATDAAHRLAQAVVVLRTCVYPCTDCRRQQLLDRAGRGHAAVFLLVIYLFWKRQRQSAVLYLIVLALLAAALLVSILAPGNALRQESVGEASVIKGLVTSVVYAVYSMANATTVPVLLVRLFTAPMVYRLVKQSKMDFSHLVWAMVLLFGLYAALGMPCFYALGFAIPERNINLIYFSYYPVVLCAIYYLSGWLSHCYAGKLPEGWIGALYEK